MVDLNCDLLKSNCDHFTKKLNCIFETCQLTHEATRITSSSSTLMDHFITNKDKRISHSGVLYIGIIDHSHATGRSMLALNIGMKKILWKLEI